MSELKSDPTASRIDDLWRSLMDEMRDLRRRAAIAEANSKEDHARIQDLSRSRAGLKAVVVALTERLVRLEVRMANAGDPPPPLTPKEQAAIDSTPADVRDQALKVGLEAQRDEERKARQARVYHHGGAITGGQTRPVHGGYPGNLF